MNDTTHILTIDIHTHILPERLPDWSTKFGYNGFVSLEHHEPGCGRMTIDGKHFRDIQKNLWDPINRIQECDSCNVDVQILSTVPVLFSYWAKPEDGYDISRFLNDHIAQVCNNFPHRFAGLGTVPLQSPKLAIRELERCMNELGLCGIEIGSHVNSWNLDDEALFEFFSVAEELQAAIFVHPWEMMGKTDMPKYWLPWLVGMPAETSRAICSLIFGGVFERLPKLRVAFAHGGGSFPATIGRIEHGFQVRPDLCAVTSSINPRSYLSKFYLDTLVHDSAMLQYLLELIGKDKLAMGSDYPFPLGEHVPGSLIHLMTQLDKPTKERLLSGTALEWLQLDRKRFQR